MIKTNKKDILVEILLTFCITLSIIILSLKITLNFKPLYYTDIITLSIQETSNLSNKEIKLNYDYIISYVQNHEKQNFILPTLTFSNQGKIHFEEVKGIFNKLDYILYALILLNTLIIYMKRKTSKIFSFLKWSSITLFLAPFFCLIPFLLNFDKGFTIFHKLLFNNNYWLLDSKLDPVITIMPQEFFFHCTILIFSLMFIFSAMFYIIYKS